MLKATFPLWQVFFRSVHFPNKPALSFCLFFKEVGWGGIKEGSKEEKEGRQLGLEKRKKELRGGSGDKRGQDVPITNLQSF